MKNFDRALIKTIKTKHPETLEEAVNIANLRFPEDKKSIMERVLRLESQGKISFEEVPATVPSSAAEYLFSGCATWFWVILGLTSAAAVLVFVVAEDAFPIIYARYVFGSVFVLFLPGYSLTRALFRSKKLDVIERFVLSMGLSLALAPIAGLLLNCTPWGIRIVPITLCLFVMTLVFAFAAVVRDYETLRKTV